MHKLTLVIESTRHIRSATTFETRNSPCVPGCLEGATVVGYALTARQAGTPERRRSGIARTKRADDLL
jgi:hypothetical protein